MERCSVDPRSIRAFSSQHVYKHVCKSFGSPAQAQRATTTTPHPAYPPDLKTLKNLKNLKDQAENMPMWFVYHDNGHLVEGQFYLNMTMHECEYAGNAEFEFATDYPANVWSKLDEDGFKVRWKCVQYGGPNHDQFYASVIGPLTKAAVKVVKSVLDEWPYSWTCSEFLEGDFDMDRFEE